MFGTAKSQGATLTAALRQVDGLVGLLKGHMAELAAHGKVCLKSTMCSCTTLHKQINLTRNI